MFRYSQTSIFSIVTICAQEIVDPLRNGEALPSANCSIEKRQYALVTACLSSTNASVITALCSYSLLFNGMSKPNVGTSCGRCGCLVLSGGRFLAVGTCSLAR